MKTLAVIPARGGSKGVPRKNVRPIDGKPLVAYSIEIANQSPLIDRVVVSTDDAEIAAAAKHYGAEVVWRPAEISTDTASSESALLHTLKHLRETEAYEPDLLVFLQCTSPLTTTEDVDGTINALLRENADTALAVTPFYHFIWQQDDGNVIGINHDKRFRPRRQDREPQFLETGAVYVMKASEFLQEKHRFFGKTALYVISDEHVLEIDSLNDFRLAEMRVREQKNQARAAALPDKIEAVVFDFDGVFTTNQVIVAQDGAEAVLCNRSDGWGIGQLKKAGIPLIVLSTEANPVVKARCDKLGIPCVQNAHDKYSLLTEWLRSNQVALEHTIYVGNDVNDLSCLRSVGCPIVVADAYPEVKAVAQIVLSKAGGYGAVREVCDLILATLSPQSVVNL